MMPGPQTTDLRDAYHTLVLAAAPVGYWPLRTDARDASGYDGHGTAHGNTEFIDDATGGWVRLDGKSYLEIPSHASFSQPTSGAGLTVEVWMRPDQLEFDREYLHWLGKGINPRHEWGLRFYSRCAERSNRLSAYLWNSGGCKGAGAYAQEPQETPLIHGEWLHLVAGFQPGDANDPLAGVVLYKNGVQRQGPPARGTLYHNPPEWRIFPQAGTAPLRLGTRDDLEFGLVGGLAEVAIYPRLLDADQVTRHYLDGRECFRSTGAASGQRRDSPR